MNKFLGISPDLLTRFLSPKDKIGLRSCNKEWCKELAEKCPICKISMEPQKKLTFYRAMHQGILRLPPCPCGNKACSRSILGHYVKKKSYSLRLFSKNFDPKRLARWRRLVEENVEEEYVYQKAYRRSGYSIHMSRMSF